MLLLLLRHKKASSDDISETKCDIIDPLVSKRRGKILNRKIEEKKKKFEIGKKW